MCFDKTGTITEDGFSFSGIWPSRNAPFYSDGVQNARLHIDACVLDNICSSSETAALGEKKLASQIVGSHRAAGMGICHSLVMLDGQLQVCLQFFNRLPNIICLQKNQLLSLKHG
jgi:magnesium-transporting ATPase (P-type)